MVKDTQYYIDGVIAGDRLVLARTITLIESSLAGHQALARTIIDSLLPRTGNAVRLGITGVPGAGKSTFIESFGTMLTEMGLRVAVLAIDPSSGRSGGSILGDKTRMEKLAVNDKAFIRPSPSSGTLGGVAGKTRETMLVCEAAGFDVIIIETVGVGQSETTVASMVDFFLVLMIAGAGDELQGIKKGVLEVADAIVINKADRDNVGKAELARKEYQAALHLLMPYSPNWTVPVLTCSALEKVGIEEIWQAVEEHRRALTDSGEFYQKRKDQARQWFGFLLDEGLKDWFYNSAKVKKTIPGLLGEIEQEHTSPTVAAARLLSLLDDTV
ncbi:methylmalonyl Co-A mutase-associated GTPase MeaB [Desulfopila inferna]|uniref:methylmalonyl Co-A mutase-associated GTPase MeaB n=1 Tax=Desulfopila inferna TaxID=468528 RepID=UPI001963EB90|nr:methylmalonyl Co-A mutase-associated GTPase MeaB [Desulfopila inferna]MBM9604369.1 methylmalonyl Co-A mutase-associated GTPase MeaB [Desulfopila inferna]